MSDLPPHSGDSSGRNTTEQGRHRKAQREEFALPEPALHEAALPETPYGRTPPEIARQSQGRGAQGSGAYAAMSRWGILADRRVAIAIVAALAVLSLFVLWDALRGTEETQATQTSAEGSADSPSQGDAGPVPEGDFGQWDTGELPPGGPVTENSSGNFTTVGAPGAKVGTGKIFTYTVEIEDTIDPATFGGADAFAATVDSILADPRGWTGRDKFGFQHVRAEELPEGKKPDLRIQLASQKYTRDLCGDAFKLETSCFYSAGNRVVINESRWVRGALTFQGDLGAYRQYLINHEVGHGIGFASHQPCTEEGRLAPVMMQQTVSLDNSVLHEISHEDVYEGSTATCHPNPWPYPVTER